ncbi:putative gluconokinase [Trichoplax sp. H2]|nr:putative gluconokinase [Trichoplax sp. H2]|eukprot:RDD46369.1 putative gluconokinase [Trichoplax sp. H2]
MGVSGCGKTTIGKALAKKIGCLFADGDDFHPPANVNKMKSGIPLTDQDRTPWLQTLNRLIQEWSQQQLSAVLACSALKKSYRMILLGNIGCGKIRVIYLKGSFQLIKDRMVQRKDHFMPIALLQSQFDTLQEPGEDENYVFAISIDNDPSTIVQLICTQSFINTQ